MNPNLGHYVWVPADNVQSVLFTLQLSCNPIQSRALCLHAFFTFGQNQQLVLLIIFHKYWSWFDRLTHKRLYPEWCLIRNVATAQNKEGPVTLVWNAKDQARVNTSSRREIKTKRETGRRRGRNKISFKSACCRLGDSAVMWGWPLEGKQQQGHWGWSNSGQPGPTLWLGGDEEGRPTIISAGRVALDCMRRRGGGKPGTERAQPP